MVSSHWPEKVARGLVKMGGLTRIGAQEDRERKRLEKSASFHTGWQMCAWLLECPVSEKSCTQAGPVLSSHCGGKVIWEALHLARVVKALYLLGASTHSLTVWMHTICKSPLKVLMIAPVTTKQSTILTKITVELERRLSG